MRKHDGFAWRPVAHEAATHASALTLANANLRFWTGFGEYVLLAIGGARLVVTDKAHTGCKKFRQRFGRDALLLTAHPDWRHRRLRGLFLQVEQDGEVEVGDTIEVLRRGPEPGAEA